MLTDDGGVTCKFSINLTGDGDSGDDIYLGVDGGVFIFAEGEDMSSDKKYEFFPTKVDFSEFRMPAKDDGTDDGQQENKHVGNTDSIALEDQYLDSDENELDEGHADMGKESDMNSQETRPDQTNTEKNGQMSAMTDSIALDDEYLESTGNENDPTSQDTGIGQTSGLDVIDEDHDSNSKEPEMNSQETGPDESDIEKDDKTPAMTDSIALEDDYMKSTGNKNDTISQGTGQGLTSEIDIIDEDQTHEKGLSQNEDPGPVGEDGSPGESEIGQEGVPFQCDENTDGFRFLHLPKTFTKFTECHDGVFHERDCPRGALFFVTLQCCINYAKFPCRRNCAN